MTKDGLRGLVLTDDRPDVLESIMPVQVRVPHRNERKVLIEVWDRSNGPVCVGEGEWEDTV